MKALSIYAGPRAFEHIQRHGLRPQDVGVIPGAAGGPKGLMLGALDRLIFGDWLAGSQHQVHLVGASIGAWRMATACLDDPASAFERFEHDYLHQHYELKPGQRRPTADFVSERFGQSLQDFFGGRVREVLAKARKMDGLDAEEVAVLMEIQDATLLEELKGLCDDVDPRGIGLAGLVSEIRALFGWNATTKDLHTETTKGDT